MKQAKITLLTMFWVAGLLMAGSEAVTLPQQFITCSIGLAVFGGASYGLVRTFRG